MLSDSVPVPPPTRPKPPPTANPTPPIPPPPAAKPPPTPAPPLVPATVKLPTTHQAPRPYQPNSAPKKRIRPIPNRRSCCSCCCCLLWFVIILLILSVMVAAACGVFWILYRPQRPKFTVASLKLSALNLTGNLDTDASGHLVSSGNLTISAKNPNHKIVALYDEFRISIFSPGNVMIANSSFHPFNSPPGNSTVMRFAFRNARSLDLDSARQLRSDLNKNKVEMGARLEMETKMGVKIGKKKTGKIGIEVTCHGVSAEMPKKAAVVKKEPTPAADSPAAAMTASKAVVVTDPGKCVVDLSIKIWGFTFGLF